MTFLSVVDASREFVLGFRSSDAREMIVGLACSFTSGIVLLDNAICLKTAKRSHQAVGIELDLDCYEDNTVCCSRH